MNTRMPGSQGTWPTREENSDAESRRENQWSNALDRYCKMESTQGRWLASAKSTNSFTIIIDKAESRGVQEQWWDLEHVCYFLREWKGKSAPEKSKLKNTLRRVGKKMNVWQTHTKRMSCQGCGTMDSVIRYCQIMKMGRNTGKTMPLLHEGKDSYNP